MAARHGANAEAGKTGLESLGQGWLSALFVALRGFRPDGQTGSGCVFFLLPAEEGSFFAFDDRSIDCDFGDIVAAWAVKHHVEHDAFDHGA